MVENPRDDCIHQILNRPGMRVKRWIGGQDACSRKHQEFHVLEVNEAEWGFAWNENQFLLFLERDVRATQQHVVAIAVGDAPHRAHGAGNHDHHIRGIGPAGEGRVHALEIVSFHAGGEAQTVRKFLRDDHLCILAHNDVNFVLRWIEMFEQALGVTHSTGSGDGDDYSQGQHHTVDSYRFQFDLESQTFFRKMFG